MLGASLHIIIWTTKTRSQMLGRLFGNVKAKGIIRNTSLTTYVFWMIMKYGVYSPTVYPL